MNIRKWVQRRPWQIEFMGDHLSGTFSPSFLTTDKISAYQEVVEKIQGGDDQTMEEQMDTMIQLLVTSELAWDMVDYVDAIEGEPQVEVTIEEVTFSVKADEMGKTLLVAVPCDAVTLRTKTPSPIVGEIFTQVMATLVPKAKTAPNLEGGSETPL